MKYSDEDIDRVLNGEFSDRIGSTLDLMHDSLIKRTDLDEAPVPGEANYRLVEEWVRDIERISSQIESLDNRIRTGQVGDNNVEKEIYQVQEEIQRTVIDEYFQAVREEALHFDGETQLFGARNFLDEYDADYFSRNKRVALEGQVDLEEFRIDLGEKLGQDLEIENIFDMLNDQVEGRTNLKQLAEGYARLILSYRDSLGDRNGPNY